ncbi:hypothetical protein T439DRAFT_323213 [Meredithblackwellia eburnea MCA 4105]
MSDRISYGTAAIILAAAVSLAALIARFPRIEPAALIFFSPILLLAGALFWIGFDLFTTWYLERVIQRRLEEALARDELEGAIRVGRTQVQGSSGVRWGGLRSRANRRWSVVPPLVFTSPAAWDMTRTRASWETTSTAHRPPFPSANPTLSATLDSLFDLILRDFILRWFNSISDSPAFPNAVERTIRETLSPVVKRVSEVDWSDVIVGRILPLITGHIDTFRSAEHALRGQNLRTHLTESDELDLFLASKYAHESVAGKLHPAVDVASPTSKPAEEAWLSSLIDEILPLIMPDREVESAAVKIMTREVVACAVLLPVVDLLSDPDFWNRLIDEKAGAAIRDQKMVEQFREALEQETIHPSPSLKATPSLKGHRRTEEISVTTSPKQFLAFVNGIDKCNNLAEARRLRSDVGTQIRRTRAMVDGKGREEVVNGHKVSDLLDFIERLLGARRHADKRIEKLGGLGPSARYSIIGDTPTRTRRRVKLRDILLQPTSLSYFTEFQERRRKALRVQFWLLVENLKDPLEEVTSESDDETIHPPPTTATIETTKEDIKLIWDMYLSANSLHSNQKHIRVIKNFLDDAASDATLSTTDIRRVRRAVFAAQHDVLTEMEEEDFPEFEKSDLFFKALADLPEPAPFPTDPLPDYFASTAVPQPGRRRRASSHPQPPPPQPFTTRDERFTDAPSPRTTTPPAPYSPPPPLTVHRTETAPPKVTLKAVFDPRPTNRRSGSESSEHRVPSRTGSLGSLDGALTKRRPTPLSDSLDFLIAGSGESNDDSRPPLFRDEDDAEDVEAEKDGTQLSDDDFVQVEAMEAIQEALNSILATDANRANNPANQAEIASRHFNSQPAPKKASALPKGRASSPLRSMAKDRIPSGSSSKSAPEETKRSKGMFGEEEEVDPSMLEEPEDDDIDPTKFHYPAPGELDLGAEIDKIATSIEKLNSQEAVVGQLIRKAELTGTASELKILVKSRDSLRREVRALHFQKNQFELQLESNKISLGRTMVSISGTTVGQAEGQNFQLYLVQVHQLASDDTFASGWIVTRRYSEFDALNQKLREKYPAARSLDLPGKRIVAAYSADFIEHRRKSLERYLQALMKIGPICESPELRSFLSQSNISIPRIEADAVKRNLSYFPGQSLVRSFYRTVTAGMDEMFTSGPSSMMDTIIQRLSQQAAELSGLGGGGVEEEDLVGSMLVDANGAPAGLKGAEEGLTYFTAPICDLFVALFELKEKNNWLRRQAMLIILQQILGGTIERKFRDAVKLVLGQDYLTSYIVSLKNAMWPGGQLKPKEAPRNIQQRSHTKESANRKLSALMPDVAANLIGRANAKQGARRLFAVLQNRRLNRHLIYSIVDEFVTVIFPELRSAKPGRRDGPLFP